MTRPLTLAALTVALWAVTPLAVVPAIVVALWRWRKA
jgi:hypothetical protein